MLTHTEYLSALDDSHQMTTDKKHIELICELIYNKQYNILELGSHRGLSTAAIALASPLSKIVSVDLSDTITQDERERYWKTLDILNIESVTNYAMDFLQDCGYYDLIFHDALHGDQAVPEYLLCSEKTKILVIHDFEQLSDTNQRQVISLFDSYLMDMDTRGRVLFIGQNNAKNN